MLRHLARNLGSRRADPVPNLVIFHRNSGPILGVVERYFGEKIRKDRKYRKVAFPRQVAGYLMSIYTDLSQYEIADELGYEGDRRHSIVCYSIKAVKSLCKHDSNIRKQVIELETMIENG